MSNPFHGKSSYAKFLPLIFTAGDERGNGFRERFLAVFERFLTGEATPEDLPGGPARSFSRILEAVSLYFHPETTPGEFLDWLAAWAGLVLKQDWDLVQKRQVIAGIIPLYRLRGTKRGIEEYLKLYLGETEAGQVKIIEKLAALQVEATSTVGVDTIIGGLPPYFFILNLEELTGEPPELFKKINVIRELIDIEKPAHTFYRIRTPYPITSAEAQIRDADMAVETVHTANGIPQAVLQLLR